jgi:ectoine hydroxylase-related dioxygenase (phytanoyl-CoA dioxygenase family)
MRMVWIEYLQRRGLIDPATSINHYNGNGQFADDRNTSDSAGQLSSESLSRISEFNQRNLHRMLTENPKINSVMKQILGDDPFWLPIAEYRANPPGDDPSKDRFIFPHQDGFYSRGMPMKICWIPIDRVDLELGGCTWVGGMHRGPILHDMSSPPIFPIRAEQLPSEGWLRADYKAGDIVIFHLNTLHSGLTNVSKDRFRLTMDIRVTEASGPVPTIGRLVRLTEEQVTLHSDLTGAEETYAVTAETLVRGTDGKRRLGAEIPTTFKLGEQIIVNSHDKRNATLVRSVN